MDQREEASKIQSLVSQILKNAKPLPRQSSPYLEPEGSPFSPPGRRGISCYELNVARTLLEPIELEARGEGYKEIASLVCLPSFEPEWAVWVAGGRQTGFSVLLTEAEKNIWYSTLTEEMQFSVAPVRMHQCHLPTDRAAAICDIWRRILSQTRYHKKSELGCDGVFYHFAYWGIGSAPLAGKTWSPEETTVPGKLAVLGHTLRDYAKDTENQDVFLKAMEDQLEWFQTRPSEMAAPNRVNESTEFC
jgi:hypothetical protein